jgi:hypothetical protein
METKLTIHELKTAWVCAPPKTGSTWISFMLAHTLNWRVMSLIRVTGRAEQQLFPKAAYSNRTVDVFMPHCHVKATNETLRLVLNNDMRIIITTRDIYDTLLSAMEHCINLGVLLPTAFIPTNFSTFSDETKADFIIDMTLPWYISFYASWAVAIALYGVKVLWMPYETVLTDPHSALKRMCSHIGVTRTDKQIDAACLAADHEPSRFNKGIPGRGLKTFTTKQITRIDHLMQYHTDPNIRTVLNSVWTRRIINADGETIVTPLEQAI